MKTYIKFISALLLTATMSPFLSSCGDEPEVSDETDTDTSTDTSSSKPSNTINGHKFVDLGLPSGLLWADRNVGADSPYDYGDFFAWGETKTKTNFSLDNYKWYNTSSSSYSNYNNYDKRTTLLSSDDAASANWGDKWHMPSKSDIIELYFNCYWTWKSGNNAYHGTNGYLVEGPNGNEIFLPASGYMDSRGLHSKGVSGNYLSRNMGSYIYDCYAFCFGDGYVEDGNCFRTDGLSVRPVAYKWAKPE